MGVGECGIPIKKSCLKNTTASFKGYKGIGYYLTQDTIYKKLIILEYMNGLFRQN